MPDEKRTIILGISSFYHDSAAALMIDGKIESAAQEERFTRIKHDEGFPVRAIEYCLKSNNLKIDEVDYVVFYDKPILKFERLIETYIKVWPRGLRTFLLAMQSWLTKKLWIENLISKKLSFSKDILFTEHHYAHAASAYYCSDFSEACVVTMDGVGEWETTTIGYGVNNKLELTHSIKFPHSLGLLYSAITYYLGFKVNSAEYKVMGLAPYGNPDIFYSKFKELIDIKEDGSFRLNMKYFAYEYGQTMTNKNFDKLFGGPPRQPESELSQRGKDIAAALQKVTEEVILKIVRYAHSLHRSDNLCLAGGVALNCVANGKILEQGLFKNIYIQPAAGDAGGAIGAACYLYFDALKNKKANDVLESIYLGPEFTCEQIEETLKNIFPKVKYEYMSDDRLLPYVAQLIADNYVIGWYQGRMEFGPRALGNRSILADARHKENWQRVNLKIKFRESFRPFAPTVLEEYAKDYFNLKTSHSPYMLLVAQALKDNIPAVTHVDNSARIQTVSEKENPKYYKLIKEFYKITNCPVIINTSFNVRGEPIVLSPEDALNCFINTDMDYLVLDNYIIAKKDNPHLDKVRDSEEYLEKFKLD